MYCLAGQISNLTTPCGCCPTDKGGTRSITRRRCTREGGLVSFSTNEVEVEPLLFHVTSHLPVPVKLTVLLVAPVLEISIVAEWLPAAVGEYDTVISVEATVPVEGVRLVSLTENIAAFVPLIANVMLPTKLVPLTVKVIVYGPPLTFLSPKARDV